MISNSRSESKLSGSGGFVKASALRGPGSKSTGPEDAAGIESPNSADEEAMLQAVDQAAASQPFPETPRKERRMEGQASPSKRSASMMSPSPQKDDIFITPPTQRQGATLFPTPSLITPRETPAAARFRQAVTGDPPPFRISPANRLSSYQPDELSDELITGLRGMSVELNEEAVAYIKDICTRQARKTQGIEKGREMVRAVVKEKDRQIAELEGQLSDLQAEKTATQTLIKGLRRARNEKE